MNFAVTSWSSSEEKDKSTRIPGFMVVGLVVVLINAVLDLERDLKTSAFIVLLMGLALTAILFLTYKGYTQAGIAGIVFTMNPFLVVITFAEGLQTGGYLFILPLLFALAFLVSSNKNSSAKIALYFFVTVCSFSVCVLFAGSTSNWQVIAPSLATQMFTFNSICVIILCAVFASMGIYFERKYKAELLTEKNKAELQETKIRIQNKNLEEIAFMSAHTIRAPLSNILALVSLINPDAITDPFHKEVVQHLQTSAQQLDDVIYKIVHKTHGREEHQVVTAPDARYEQDHAR